MRNKPTLLLPPIAVVVPKGIGPAGRDGRRRRHPEEEWCKKGVSVEEEKGWLGTASVVKRIFVQENPTEKGEDDAARNAGRKQMLNKRCQSVAVRLSQRHLHVFDAAAQHVLDAPARGRQLLALCAHHLRVLLGQLQLLGQRAARDAGAELELQQVADLVAGLEHAVEVVLGVRGADAEACAAGHERGGRVAHNDDGDLALEHLVREGGHLGRVVQHDGDDGGVVVAVDDEAEALQAQAEVARVEAEALKALLALAGDDFAVDDAQGGGDLNKDGGRGRLGVQHSRVSGAQLVDDGLVCGEVATICAEGLGQRAHKQVHFAGRDAEVVADTASAGSNTTNGVGLVNEEEELVLLLELDDAGQVAHGALHGVQTLDGDQNLLPWAVGAGLALGDGFAQRALEIAHIVVLEHGDHGSRKTGTESDRRVVQLIRDQQTALADDCGESGGVCDETHREDHGSWLPDELGDQVLNLDCELRCARVGAGAGHCDPVLPDGGLGCIGARPLGLGEAKVVVGAQVEGLGCGACHLEGVVAVVRLAVEQGDEASRDTGGGPREAVVDPHLKAAGVEVIKVAVERSVAILLLQVAVVLPPEALAKEVAYMSEYYQDEVADVGCEEEVVRRLVFDGIAELALELACVAVRVGAERAELCVLAGQSPLLLGREGLEEGLVGLGGHLLAGGCGEANGRQGYGCGVDLLRRRRVQESLLLGNEGFAQSSSLRAGLGRVAAEQRGELVAPGEGGPARLVALFVEGVGRDRGGCRKGIDRSGRHGSVPRTDRGRGLVAVAADVCRLRWAVSRGVQACWCWRRETGLQTGDDQHTGRDEQLQLATAGVVRVRVRVRVGVRARLEVGAGEGGHGLAGTWSGRRMPSCCQTRCGGQSYGGGCAIHRCQLLPALPVRALPSPCPCSNYWRREAKKVHLRD